MRDEAAAISDQPGERIDLHADRLSLLLHLLGCLVFVAIGAAALVWRPSSGRFDVSPGSLGEIVMALGTLLFGFLAVFIARLLLRRGPLVSVGPRGILPVAIAQDWLPWSSVLAARRADPWLVLRLDEAKVAALPLRRSARVLGWMNAHIGRPGCHIHAASLRGGPEALDDAVRKAAPPRLRRSSA